MELGKKLKILRKKQMLTLKQVSMSSGLSTGLLSSIERGKANPSMTSLIRFATALGTTLSELFNSEASENLPPEVVPAAGNPVKPSCEIVRKGSHKVLILPGSNIQYQLLTPNLRKSMEVLLEITPPGKGALEDNYIQYSDSCAYVLEGTYEVEFDGSKVLVKKGDSLYFPKGSSCKYVNVGKKAAKAIIVNVPPTI